RSAGGLVAADLGADRSSKGGTRPPRLVLAAGHTATPSPGDRGRRRCAERGGAPRTSATDLGPRQTTSGAAESCAADRPGAIEALSVQPVARRADLGPGGVDPVLEKALDVGSSRILCDVGAAAALRQVP